jgi:hypothetical protein
MSFPGQKGSIPDSGTRINKSNQCRVPIDVYSAQTDKTRFNTVNAIALLTLGEKDFARLTGNQPFTIVQGRQFGLCQCSPLGGLQARALHTAAYYFFFSQLDPLDPAKDSLRSQCCVN